MVQMIQETDQDSSEPPEEYFRKLYKRHFQGALVLAGATLIMWLFAMAAYLLDIISYPHFIGVSLASLYLIAINPPALWVFKRIRHQGRLVSLSILINLLEIIGFTAVIYFLGGIEATYLTPLYAAVIAYVGSVSKRRHTFLITGICIVAYNAMVLLEGASLIPWYKVFPDFHIPWSHRLARMFVVDGLLLVVAYITSYTALLLRKAKTELLTAHGVLERQVAERTAELSRANEELRLEIAVRKQATEALRENEIRLRTIVEGTHALLANVDINGYFTYVNEATARAVGYARSEELIGMSYLHFIHPEDREQVLNTFINQINMRQLSSMQEFRIINTEGKVKWFSFLSTLAINDGQLVGQSGVAQDITERKQAEEAKAKFEVQLQQALKFEAIATLAGGIAHDFNNLLMGIQGRISLVSLNIETSHPHWEHIQAIEEYIRSATNLTRQLLGFAKGGKYEVKPIDMNELVLSSSAMFGRTKKEIRIHTTCKASPLVVEADRGQIEQVLLNMYINAWQAMPLGGGDLSLETNIVALDEVYCKSNKIEPGRYVNVSIKDTGAGMDEATRLRIFDPFFTTKEKSRGTGMGLASALGIIKNHGGMIAVDSEVGHGTTFNIFLPFSDKEAYREVPTDGSCITGSANILLVDDEEFIVVVCQTMLEKLGYRVIVCGGGQEAVKVITDMGNEIDLVILDMIMPGMDGGSTFDHIREIQPDMPVLLSSGYSIDGHADNIIRKGCNGFIQKPYNISELSQKIKKMLDESQKAQLKEQQHS